MKKKMNPRHLHEPGVESSSGKSSPPRGSNFQPQSGDQKPLRGSVPSNYNGFRAWILLTSRLMPGARVESSSEKSSPPPDSRWWSHKFCQTSIHWRQPFQAYPFQWKQYLRMQIWRCIPYRSTLALGWIMGLSCRMVIITYEDETG